MQTYLEIYLENIEQNRKNGTEHTFITALKNYLDTIKSNQYVSIDEELKKNENERKSSGVYCTPKKIKDSKNLLVVIGNPPYNSNDKIYIINLHGNSLKKEGYKNVFDIMIGVSIAIFVKRKKSLKRKIVKYFSTLDSKIILRQQKFDFLETHNLKTVPFVSLKPMKLRTLNILNRL